MHVYTFTSVVWCLFQHRYNTIGTIGCVVLLCFVVCLTLLASFFLPSASLIKHVYTDVSLYLCILMSLCCVQVNTILPSEVSDNAHCLSDLIASAMAFDTQAERK